MKYFSYKQDIDGYNYKEQSKLFDLFKAFDKIESRHISALFLRKYIFSFTYAQHALGYHLI